MEVHSSSTPMAAADHLLAFSDVNFFSLVSHLLGNSVLILLKSQSAASLFFDLQTSIL